MAGTCGQFTVSQLNASGSLTNASVRLDVTLSGQGSGSFYRDSACATLLTNNIISIPAGSSSADFYLKDGVAESLTVTASATSMITSGNVALSISPLLSITTAPSTGQGCVAFSTQPVVRAQNADTSTATGYTGSVTVSAYSDSGCTTAATGVLSGQTLAATAGAASFTTLKYQTVSSPTDSIYLKATGASASSSTCVGPVAISSTGAKLLAFSTQPPTTAVAGATLAATSVSVQDACGFLVSGATNSITLGVRADSACTTTISGGTFSGGGAKAATAGVATYSTLSYTKATTVYIRATATGLTTGCSSALLITPTTPNKFGITTTTSPTQNACSPAYSLIIRDTYGNATNAVADTTVNVAATNSAAIYSDSSCGNVAASITIPTGSSTGSVYLKDTVSESTTLTASGALTSGTLQVFFNAKSTVDDFVPTGGTGGNDGNFVFDPAGRIFHAMEATYASGGSHAVIRKSTNGGTTWTTVDDFQYQPGATAGSTKGMGVTSDAASRLYAVTAAVDPSQSNLQIAVFRKSTDNGTTWTTSGTYQDGTNAVTPNALRSNNSADQNGGKLFMTGYTLVGAAARGVLATSTDQGATWTGVNWTQMDQTGNIQPGNTVLYKNATASIVGDVVTDGAGNIYVNAVFHNGTCYQCAVVKSADAGSTWAVVDDYALVNLRLCVANTIGVDSTRRVYWSGYSFDAGNLGHWIIRRSDTNGANWTTIDNWTGPAASSYPMSQGIRVDSNGILYASGYYIDSLGGKRAVIRKSTDDGVSWNTIEEFFYAGGFSSIATWLELDSSNNPFIVGTAADSSGVNHVYVRK